MAAPAFAADEIVIMGDKVEHKINGEAVRSATARTSTSPFKLRAEIGAIRIRNIRVKS